MAALQAVLAGEVFQYKICYSKIQAWLLKLVPDYHFNTKFVIAK